MPAKGRGRHRGKALQRAGGERASARGGGAEADWRWVAESRWWTGRLVAPGRVGGGRSRDPSGSGATADGDSGLGEGEGGGQGGEGGMGRVGFGTLDV